MSFYRLENWVALALKCHFWLDLRWMKAGFTVGGSHGLCYVVSVVVKSDPRDLEFFKTEAQ